jgi:hypothetical protein
VKQFGVQGVELVAGENHARRARRDQGLRRARAGRAWATTPIASRTSASTRRSARSSAGFRYRCFNTRSWTTVAHVEQRRWNDVMAMTWFCHYARGRRLAVRFCNPASTRSRMALRGVFRTKRRGRVRTLRKTLQPLRGKTRQLLRRLRA